jgi:hypothetical protein
LRTKLQKSNTETEGNNTDADRTKVLVNSTVNASTGKVIKKDSINVDKLGDVEQEGRNVVSIHLFLFGGFMQFILILNTLCLHIQQQDLINNTLDASKEIVVKNDSMDVDKSGDVEQEERHIISIHLVLC